MRTSRLQYGLLLVVIAASMTCYIASVVASLEKTYDPRVPRSPVQFGYRLNAVSGVMPEAFAAGIRFGDPILNLNGRSFTGYEILLEELRKSKSGEPFTVTYIPRPKPAASDPTSSYAGHPELSQDGPPRTVTITLQPETPVLPSFYQLLTGIYFLVILCPLVCLLLGYWVVAAKPRDLNAWFMLGIMVYFPTILSESGFWPDPFYSIIGFWSLVTFGLGPLSVMLFGIYFPERTAFDKRFPWFKVPVIAALALLTLVDMVYAWGFGHNFNAVRGLAALLMKYTSAQIVLGMAAFSIYFFALGHKRAFVTQLDQRRRLQIIYWGSTVGNIPMLCVVLYSMFTGHDVGSGIPPWLSLAALCIFTLFPLSLAYAVVVHRAMDLRILIRQGSQYALARTGIWIIRFLIITGVASSIATLLSHHPYRLDDAITAAAFILLLIVWRFRAAKRISTFIDRKFFREAYSAEQILADLAMQVQTFTDTKPLMETVAGCIAGAMHVDRIAILLRSGEVFRLQLATGIGPVTDASADLILPAESETISALARAKGPSPNLRVDDPTEWAVATTPAEREALARLGAEILIPLPGRSRLSGVLALGPKRSEEPYSRSDRSLLQSVALHTGLAIENSELLHSLAAEAAMRERVNREMEIAREVQERMFPQTLPVLPGVDYAGHCRPALGVGGDYYDFFPLKDRGDGSFQLGIAIGDVSGKGISAALLMSSLRASLRGMTRTSQGDLAAVMRDVNELVFDSSASNRYATFFYAQYDPQSRLLAYVNAGHNAPIVIRRSAATTTRWDVLRLELGGPVVGLLREAEFEQANLPILPGDILLAFTDGISESMRADEEEWGEERMIGFLTAHAELPAPVLLEAVLDEATRFAAGAPQYDDMTLLVFKFGAPRRL
jgi:sigma-B regulation protein RsbU (phosphoserine phosphatase)